MAKQIKYGVLISSGITYIVNKRSRKQQKLRENNE